MEYTIFLSTLCLLGASGQSSFSRFGYLTSDNTAPLCAISLPNITANARSKFQCTGYCARPKSQEQQSTCVGVNYRDTSNVCELYYQEPNNYSMNEQGCQYLQRNPEQYENHNSQISLPVAILKFAQALFTGVTVCSCPLGLHLLSCGFGTAYPSTADFNQFALPNDSVSCACSHKYGAFCVAHCSNAIEGFEIQSSAMTNSSSPQAEAICSAGKKVLGCSILPDPYGEHDINHQYYPTADGSGCTCSDSGGAQCVATCGSNIKNHEIVSIYDNTRVHPTCSPGNIVLGCGMGQTGGYDLDAIMRVVNSTSCRCYNGHGVRCYAICGQFTGFENP